MEANVEVIAAGGTPERNSTYVMEYDGDTLALKKHFILDRVVTEGDLL